MSRGWSILAARASAAPTSSFRGGYRCGGVKARIHTIKSLCQEMKKQIQVPAKSCDKQDQCEVSFQACQNHKLLETEDSFDADAWLNLTEGVMLDEMQIYTWMYKQQKVGNCRMLARIARLGRVAAERKRVAPRRRGR